MQWVEACSIYDFQATWKQIRKQGWTSLLSTWDEYQQWKQKFENPSAILFSGKIGAGKSVVLANVVDDLHLIEDALVVYFFCRHDIPESLKSRTILGSLARQYLSQLPEKSDGFNESVPMLDVDQLTALMKPDIDRRTRFLLLDGLDECGIEDRRSVLTQLSWLQKESNWRLAFSARLSVESFVEQHITLKWHVSLPASNPDIKQYIERELEARLEDGRLRIGDANLLPEIRTALLAGANGMFLWVVLQLDQVCAEVSDHSIRLAIRSLPRDLSEVYARILSHSASADAHRYHIRLLKFLTAAYMPLTMDQIQEMASVTIGDTSWDPSKCINNISKLVGFCGSLVMIEEEEQTVRFVHHSARSFCQGVLGGFGHWKFCFSDDEAHREVGETAVTYLNYGIFDTRLSTQVTPTVDVGGVTGRIIRHTLGKSTPMTRFALGLVKPKQEGKRDIGQFLAQANAETTKKTADAVSHAFLPYARKFWLLHTRAIENVAAHELWKRLFDEVDVHDLQLLPHVFGPLDNFEISSKHPLAAAFVWAINYSHLLLFERLMDLNNDYPLSARRPWARFHLFRSLLQYLQPQGKSAKAPCLEPRMIQRLLPMAISLKAYHAVEWMLPCADFKQTLLALEVALSSRNYRLVAFISTQLASGRYNTLELPHEIYERATSDQDACAISLLVKTGAAKPADPNASALWNLLKSDMHQAPLLRIIFILANAGIQLKPSNFKDIQVACQLLAISLEINTEMASKAIGQILMTNSKSQWLHQRIFRQACSIDSLTLANATLSSFFHHVIRVSGVRTTTCGYPFQGDELSLTLQTVSKDRNRLADWLIKKGANWKDKRMICRVLLLRNWQLAAKLLPHAGQDLTKTVLKFCVENELLHLCVIQGDLSGTELLLTLGMDFSTPSAGPIFEHQTVVQTLAKPDADFLSHICMVELLKRGAFAPARTTRGFTVREAMERMRIPDEPSTWDPQIQQIQKVVRMQLESGICSDEYSWFICAFAASMREAIQIHFIPGHNNVGTCLEHLRIWLALLGEILQSCSSPPDCGKQQGILAIREIFCATVEMSTTKDVPMSPEVIRYRWEIEMGLWQFVNLFVSRQSGDHVDWLFRDGALRELAFALCKRSLRSVLPKFPRNSSDAINRMSQVLRLADLGGDLAWVPQYLSMRIQGFSVYDFCAFSADWEYMVRGPKISEETKEAFRLMGWGEQQLNRWIEAVEQA